MQQKSEREEERGEKGDVMAAEPSPNSETSRCPQLQAGSGPGNKAALPNSSEYHFCLHRGAFFSFGHSVNSWILKCFRLKLPLFAAISYSRLSAWQLPETLVVGSNLPLLPSKIVCKWDKIFFFFWHLLERLNGRIFSTGLMGHIT